MAWQRGTYLKHLDVCPRCKDDAIDAKDAEDDVVRGHGVELTARSPKVERPSSSWPLPVPVPADTSRRTPMCCAEEIGRVELLEWCATPMQLGCVAQRMSWGEYTCDAARG